MKHYTIRHFAGGTYHVLNPKGRVLSFHPDASSASDKADRLNLRYFGRFFTLPL